MKTLVYLAHPVRHADPAIRRLNYLRAVAFGRLLAREGYAPFVPGASVGMVVEGYPVHQEPFGDPTPSAPATDPPDLLVYSGRPGNHVEVAHLAREAHKGGGRVVAAWGALGGTPDLQRLLRERRDALLPLLDGIPLWCLGKTQDGSPRHPSRLGYGVPMERWR